MNSNAAKNLRFFSAISKKSVYLQTIFIRKAIEKKQSSPNNNDNIIN